MINNKTNFKFNIIIICILILYFYIKKENNIILKLKVNVLRVIA